MPTLEDAIATARVARGLSQQQLAERLGVSQAVYSKGESGVAPFKPERVGKLARILGFPGEYFFRTEA